jgi:hypothetical protein
MTDGFTEPERPSTRQRLDELKDIPAHVRRLEQSLHRQAVILTIHSYAIGVFLFVLVLAVVVFGR